MRTTSTNNASSSVYQSFKTSPIDIESFFDGLEGKKATKLTKRSKDKVAAIAIEEASLEHAQKTNAEYLHYARQNYESKIRMEAKLQEMAYLKLLQMDTLRMDKQQLIVHNMKIDDLVRMMQQQSQSQTQQSRHISIYTKTPTEVNWRVDIIWSEIVVPEAFCSRLSCSKYWVRNLNFNTLHIINVVNRCTSSMSIL